MEQQYLVAFIWLAGFLLAFWMIRVEHQAEGNTYTQGDRVANVLLAILSVVMILIILVKTWVAKVGAKGYWNKPVKQKLE